MVLSLMWTFNKVHILNLNLHIRFNNQTMCKSLNSKKAKRLSRSATGDSGWISGTISSLKEELSMGTDCPEKWLGHHSWKCSKNVWIWHLGTWFSGEDVSDITLMAGLDVPRWVFKP